MSKSEPDYHEFVHRRHDGTPDFGNTIQLPRVSTIAKVVSNPNPLMWWAFRTGLAGVEQLIEEHTGLGHGLNAVELESMLKDRGLRHDQQRDVAAERGIKLHTLAERLTKGETVTPLTPWEEGVVAWFEQYQPKLLASEQFVWYFTGPKSGFSGSFDSKMRVAVEALDRTFIVDYKTRKKAKDRRSDPLTPYESEWLQVGGYWLADGAEPTCGTAILTIDGDGNFRFNDRSPEEARRDADAFLKVCEVYDYLTGRA